MRRKLLVYFMVVALPLAMLAYPPTLSGLGSQDPQQDGAKISKETCLACHGPYDKLASTEVRFKTPEGETVMPHQYVPHQEKRDIPECTECHTPHAIPLEDKSTVVKPTHLKWCYTYCHHKKNLQNCSDCH